MKALPDLDPIFFELETALREVLNEMHPAQCEAMTPPLVRSINALKTGDTTDTTQLWQLIEMLDQRSPAVIRLRAAAVVLKGWMLA